MQTKETQRHKELYKAQRYIAGNLRLLMHLNGLSQEQTAAQLNISRSCYASLERGTRIPDFLTIQAIADVFDVSLDYLLTFDITEHVLSLLRRNHSKMDAYTFAEGYLRLSYGARKHIQDKVTGLAEREDAFYMFPWDYEKAARADL